MLQRWFKQYTKNPTNLSTKMPANIPPNNGSNLCGFDIPDEIIINILSFANKEDIIKFSRVCRKWHELVKCGVWKHKAEREYSALFSQLNLRKRLPWDVYRNIVWKKCYGQNLLKNNSGQKGFRHWSIITNGGNQWIVENPPVGVGGLEHGGIHQYAFATSYMECSKRQIVDLHKAGFSLEVLNSFQPDILVSEWYSARWDCDSRYRLEVKLLDKDKKVIECYNFNADLRGWVDGWKEVKHIFQSYGMGVKYVSFYHAGVDYQYWAGHYGSKMTGAVVEIPLYNLKKMQICNDEDMEVFSV